MKITIITVTYNSSKFLDDYFSSIGHQKNNQLEIILVDSCSTDKTVDKIKSKIIKLKDDLKLKLIKSSKNIGYAEGNNWGVKEAMGEYLFFLGPDTKLEKKCLQNLLEKAKKIKEKDFLLLCRQKRYDSGEFLFDGICLDIFSFPYRLYKADCPQTSKPPFYCDGTAIFLPKKTFMKLGQFDADLFLFCDDIDLSWKAHLLKIPLISVPEAVVFHYSGGSLSGGIRREEKYRTTYMRRYLGERNTITNFLKNYSVLTLIWILPIYLAINVFEMTIFSLFGRGKVAYQYLAAWWWNVKKIKPILQKRRWIQKRRKVSDGEILKKLYFGSGKLNAFIKIKIPTFENL